MFRFPNIGPGHSTSTWPAFYLKTPSMWWLLGGFFTTCWASKTFVGNEIHESKISPFDFRSLSNKEFHCGLVLCWPFPTTSFPGLKKDIPFKTAFPGHNTTQLNYAKIPLHNEPLNESSIWWSLCSRNQGGGTLSPPKSEQVCSPSHGEAGIGGWI